MNATNFHTVPPKLTFLCCYQIKIGITKSALEVINVKNVALLTIFSSVKEKFVVIISEIEIFVFVSDRKTQQERDEKQNFE